MNRGHYKKGKKPYFKGLQRKNEKSKTSGQKLSRKKRELKLKKPIMMIKQKF